MKAYVRGQVISYITGEKRKKSKSYRVTSPSENLNRERKVQTEFDSLTNDNAVDLFLNAHHNLYE